jgi:hypothetical protein
VVNVFFDFACASSIRAKQVADPIANLEVRSVSSAASVGSGLAFAFVFLRASVVNICFDFACASPIRAKQVADPIANLEVRSVLRRLRELGSCLCFSPCLRGEYVF